jgi:hypothetical protein
VILALAPETSRLGALGDEMEGEVRRLIKQRWTLVEEATTSRRSAGERARDLAHADFRDP